MEKQLTGLIPYQESLECHSLFGYTTRGLPGVEIIGLGKEGRSIKEKLIFLSKCRKLKIPLYRYVLCVDGEAQRAQWLELPLLILYWSLAEVLKIYSLHEMMTCGRIYSDGIITQPKLTDKHWESLNSVEFPFSKIILDRNSVGGPQLGQSLEVFDSSQILNEIPGLKVTSVNLNRQGLNHTV